MTAERDIIEPCPTEADPPDPATILGIVRRAQQMETLGWLTRGQIHDFKNKLSVMIGHAQILYQRSDDPQIRDHMRTIIDSGMSASEAAKRIFDYSPNPRVTTLDLAPVIKQAANLLNIAYWGRAQIDTEHIEPGLHVRAAASDTYQILHNVCANAVEASREGQSIAIRLERHTATGAPGSESAVWAAITIRDEADAWELPCPTDALVPGITTKKGHMGMGLPVTAQILAELGGSIEICPALGRGTLVRMLLPCGDPPRKQRAASTPVIKRAQHIAVIDAHTEVRQMMQSLLEQYKYAPHCFGEFDVALGELKRDRIAPDAILLDALIAPPRLLPAVDRLRSAFPHARIVLLSTQGITPAMEDLRQIGFIDEILSKPLFVAEVLHTLGESA